MADLLLGASTTLSCSLIPEPLLLFGGKNAVEDPKTGLTAYGPYSNTDATRRPIIRLGIVGPAEAIDRARTLVERMTTSIPPRGHPYVAIWRGFAVQPMSTNGMKPDLS